MKIIETSCSSCECAESQDGPSGREYRYRVRDRNGPEWTRVNEIRSVGCGHDDNIGARLHTIHEGEELRKRLGKNSTSPFATFHALVQLRRFHQ